MMLFKPNKRIVDMIVQKINTQAGNLEDMLNFIQSWSHFQERNKMLIKLGINGKEAQGKLEDFRSHILLLPLYLGIDEYVIGKRPGVRREYKKMLDAVLASINKKIEEDAAIKQAQEMASKHVAYDAPKTKEVKGDTKIIES